ncbi:MAG: hypothetical protein AAF211_08910 [Myxococcota bacterium]
MAWFEDGGPIDYFRLQSEEHLVAMGWLEPDHDFVRGSVTPVDLASICGLLVDPWWPDFVFCGSHDCGFCAAPDGPSHVTCSGVRVGIGWTNLFVPSIDEHCVYVAPSMIVHYIDAHGYQPSSGFLEAVRRCPPMGSEAHLAALVGIAGPGIQFRRRRAR